MVQAVAGGVRLALIGRVAGGGGRGGFSFGGVGRVRMAPHGSRGYEGRGQTRESEPEHRSVGLAQAVVGEEGVL